MNRFVSALALAGGIILSCQDWVKASASCMLTAKGGISVSVFMPALYTG